MTRTALCPVCRLPLASGDGAAAEGRCSRCGVSLERPQTPEALFAEVAALARKDRLIDAIRYYRGLTGAGLKEAKDAVELIASGGRPQLSPKALQQLTGTLPADDGLPPAQRAELEQLLLAGKKIQAIKRHRELTGSGLKEAKDAVESLEAVLRSAYPLPFPGDVNRPKGSNTGVWVVLAFVLGLLVAFLLLRR